MIVNHQPKVNVNAFHCIDGGAIVPGMRVWYILRVSDGLDVADIIVDEKSSFHTSIAFFSSKDKRDQFIKDIVKLSLNTNQ